MSVLPAPSYAQNVSLVSAAALGEALLFLATSSEVELTDRRVILVRELALQRVRGILDGRNQRSHLPRHLAGESPGIMHELRRAVSYGTTAALSRLMRNPSAIVA